jgi:hypothetical protein
MSRASDLAHDLIGTCNSFPIPSEELETTAELVEFDSLAFCCDGCGWWVSTEELYNETSRDLCQECHDEENEDE